MIPGFSFEELFLKACNFIGYTEDDLIQTFGEPNNIETGANSNRYLIYDAGNFMFEISKSRGIVICAMTPVRPDPTKIQEGYYNVLGVKVGDAADRVYQIWGNPSVVEGKELVYTTKLGTTSKDYNFETRLAIKDGVVEDFSGVLFIQPAKKPKNGCFIATVCYGDYESTEVLVLRKYRDDILLKNKIGKIGISIYYTISPFLAKMIDKSNLAKKVIRKYFLDIVISKIQRK